ncbi:MAG: hypothetical protein JSR76_03135 [Verrucomicrobia bacterium]|nr:hypothetical protein [Verrucomicrobiota bacterium]
MSGFISFIEKFHESVSPEYVKKKEGAQKEVQQVGLIATAALVGSVAFGVLGVLLTISGGFPAVIGLGLILVTLPLGYLAFNTYTASKNMRDIIDSPKEYQKFLGLDQAFDKQKIKNKVSEGTFWFNWIVDIAIDKMM